MKDWIPKVGDLVTPDPQFVKGSLENHIGEVFTVVDVRGSSLDVDRGTAKQTAKHWNLDVWMPAKNQIVINILNDL